MSSIPWRRVRRGLAQYVQEKKIDLQRIPRVLESLQGLLPQCGNASNSRQAAYRLGCALLGDHPRILVSACPPYIHDGQHYTFQGLGDGVPLLVTLHAQFLKRLEPHLEGVEVVFLFGDHEAHSPMVVHAAGISKEEFLRRVRCSERATGAFLKPMGWKVAFVTEYIPDFLRQAEAECQAMQQGSVPRELLEHLNEAKAPVYRRIGHPPEDWMLRTTENSAAYVVLARYAAGQSAIVCNHTTPNLLWYRKIGVPVLHNHHLRPYD